MQKTYPPHLSSEGKGKKNAEWGLGDGMTLDLAKGQEDEGLVRGAGCLCIRREVGQWVLVLVGGVDGAVARQEGVGGQEGCDWPERRCGGWPG